MLPRATGAFYRVGICDSLAQPRIASLVGRSREEEPELGIRIFDAAILAAVQ